MNVANRYGRWLLMMFVVMNLWLAGASVLNGQYGMTLLSAGWSVFLIILYRRWTGAGSWRQVTSDLGGGIIILSILGLIVWASMVLTA